MVRIIRLLDIFQNLRKSNYLQELNTFILAPIYVVVVICFLLTRNFFHYLLGLYMNNVNLLQKASFVIQEVEEFEIKFLVFRSFLLLYK